MPENARSYTSQSEWFDFARQATYLYRSHTGDIPGDVRRSIEDAKHVERCLYETFGVAVKDLDLLEIGPGQYLSHMTYFSRHNRVTGIDLDVIACSNDLATYVRMFKVNGAWRTVKTLARKMLRIDRKHQAELCRQLELNTQPQHNVLQMDASDMRFERELFDLVYSRAVFHHLPSPIKSIKEIVRILRPGGLAYISLHPYTNPTGCLDLHVLSGDPDTLDMWPHLRPESQEQVQSTAYLNKLRIPEWRRLFSAELPGVRFVLSPCQPKYIEAAHALHQQGVLTQYSIEELATGALVLLWRKPPSYGAV